VTEQIEIALGVARVPANLEASIVSLAERFEAISPEMLGVLTELVRLSELLDKVETDSHLADDLLPLFRKRIGWDRLDLLEDALHQWEASL
jgi:hypothetical protein